MIRTLAVTSTSLCGTRTEYVFYVIPEIDDAGFGCVLMPVSPTGSPTRGHGARHGPTAHSNG
jgi:hypothetical protein